MPSTLKKDYFQFEDENFPVVLGLAKPVVYELTEHPDKPDDLILFLYTSPERKRTRVKLPQDHLRVLQRLLKAASKVHGDRWVLAKGLAELTSSGVPSLYQKIKTIREKIFDAKEPYRLIENEPAIGYRVCESVRVEQAAGRERPVNFNDDGFGATVGEGDLRPTTDTALLIENDAVRIRHWDDGKWFKRVVQESLALQQAKGNNVADADRECVEILTTAFSRRVKDERNDIHDVTRLLAAGVRVNVLLINPEKTFLMNARHGLRLDYPKTHFPSALEWAQAHAAEQIEWLGELIAEYPIFLEAKLTDSMPHAFVIRNSARALIGFFVAYGSFADFPLLEVTPASPFWDGLEEDWDVRWRASGNIPIEPVPPKQR